MAGNKGESLFALSNVRVVRDGRTILAVDKFACQIGENIAITGPNGAGKSTLLHLLTGAVRPFRDEGKVCVLGDVRPSAVRLRSTFAIVDNDLEQSLLNDPTVRELTLSGVAGTVGVLAWFTPSEEDVATAESSEKLVGLAAFADRKYSTLSSGEKRRAWIARALVTQPIAVLLDEPTAHLDADSRAELLELLEAPSREGISIIMATHFEEEISGLFHRRVKLRNGRIEEDVRLRSQFPFSVSGRPGFVPETPQEYLEAMRLAPVYDVAIRSPLVEAKKLSAQVGARIFLKREDLQQVNSFKLRGAYAKMAVLDPEVLAKGVVAASAGNHAQGVALAAQKLGISATIVVPTTTPSVKIEAIRALGADLILEGDNYDDSSSYARKLSAETGQALIHPYDDPWVIAGQGTVGLEIAEQAPDDLSAVFVAVGGGGLVSGVALAIKQLRPGVKVIGVEPEDSDAMHRSLSLGHRVTLDKVGLLADGVAVRTVGETTFRLAQEWVDEVIVVSNDEICAAVREIFEDSRAVLEPSGALAFAGVKRYLKQNPVNEGSCCAIACGANISFDRLRYVAERSLVGERREAILGCKIPERPGAFRVFCEAIGRRNVTEFNYRMGDVDQAAVFVGLSVSGDEERLQLIEDLVAKGYETIDLTGDELATTHLRHMVGGRSHHADDERLFHVDFPERVGALGSFLAQLGDRFNISLFHYRNHGSDRGRVLVGFQVAEDQANEFETFLNSVDMTWIEVTENSGLALFLS